MQLSFHVMQMRNFTTPNSDKKAKNTKRFTFYRKLDVDYFEGNVYTSINNIANYVLDSV